MRGVPPGSGWYPPESAEPPARHRALPDAHRRAQVPPSKTHRQFFFFATYSALFPDAGALPASSEPSPQAPLRLRSRLLAPSAPRRASVCPNPTPQKHTAKKKKLRPNRRCFPDAGALPASSEPSPRTPVRLRSRLLALSAPRRASACPNPTPKNTQPIFFLRPSSALFPDAGALPASSKPSARPPALPAAPRRRGDFQIRVGSNIRAKSAAGDSLGHISSSFGDHERVVGVDDPAVSLPPSTTPVFLVLLPSVSLGPGFSRTVQNFSRTLSEIFFAFPLILHHLPSPSHISGPHPAASHNNPQRPQAAMSHKVPQPIAPRAHTRRRARDGATNVACAADVDIAQHAAGTLTDAAFLARMKWKVGHTNDWQRQQREYRGCDVGKTHIWICGWEVSRWYYCERLAQLEELCDGGERATIDCVCGVSHREYFSFATVGGFTEFTLCPQSHDNRGLRLHVGGGVDKGLMGAGRRSSFEKQREDKASVPCWPDPCAVPTKQSTGPTKTTCGWASAPTKATYGCTSLPTKATLRAGSYADKARIKRDGVPVGGATQGMGWARGGPPRDICCAWDGRAAGRCATSKVSAHGGKRTLTRHMGATRPELHCAVVSPSRDGICS
ncbi:hypothetical protein B0H14DRAFT_3448969 [Mycena olivaceomarginata]|nr:hypothetical protein B0H14DRAFT_3448969 [Mycena olivaceomarginata]